MFNIFAAQISDNIDIDSFKTAFSAELLYSNYYELFYEIDTEIYVSVFRYGVVCFFNYNDTKISEFTKLISQYCTYFYDSELSKAYKIKPNAKVTKFGFNKAELMYCDIESIRIIMLNIAQSVALDYYFQLAKIQLEETNKYISFLEKSGKLAASDKELKKIIGKTRNIKNKIVENLRLLDSISVAGQNDYLIIIDYGMKDALFMEKRANHINEELEIINEHLEGFRNILNQGASMKLAWIEIVLLATFVVDIIIDLFS